MSRSTRSPPEPSIEHPLRRKPVHELSQVVSGPGRVVRKAFPALFEVNRRRKDVDDRGIDAAPTASTEPIEPGCHFIRNTTNRQLFGHECMISQLCLHDAAGRNLAVTRLLDGRAAVITGATSIAE